VNAYVDRLRQHARSNASDLVKSWRALPGRLMASGAAVGSTAAFFRGSGSA